MTSGGAKAGLAIFDTEGKQLRKWTFDNNDYQFGNPAWSPGGFFDTFIGTSIATSPSGGMPVPFGSPSSHGNPGERQAPIEDARAAQRENSRLPPAALLAK